jgi:hypothetical protein
MHRTLAMTVVAFLAALVVSAAPAHASGGTAFVREVLEQATRRSGRELTERAARESAELTVEAAVKRYGPAAAEAIADGGLELVEAGARYGDDVMRIAVEADPAVRRALALDAGNLVPLVRELGPEALEIEARSPGLARQVFANFGADGARTIATTVPADDLPRLIAYADRADSPQTRKLLLETYEKEGRTIFDRIPPKLVLAGGLTAAMLYGTHRMTAPAAAVGERIAADPDLARRTVDWLALVGGGLLALVTTVCLWRFGILRGPRAPAPPADPAHG